MAQQNGHTGHECDVLIVVRCSFPLDAYAVFSLLRDEMDQADILFAMMDRVQVLLD